MVAISTGSSSPLRGLKFYQAKYAREFVLGHDHSGLTTGPAILVLGKVNDTMERIGLGWVDQFNYKRWNKDGAWKFANEKEIFLWKNPSLLEPLELVKSWEEIRLG